MNIETQPQILSKPGKHGRARIAMPQPPPPKADAWDDMLIVGDDSDEIDEVCI